MTTRNELSSPGHQPPAGEQDPLTRQIIACAIDVHRELGPGLLEKPYAAAMCITLLANGLRLEREKIFPVMFRGARVGSYRPDLIVNETVVVEIKAAARYHPVFLAQMLTYLRITNCKVGLLLNFNVRKMIDGVKRVSL